MVVNFLGFLFITVFYSLFGYISVLYINKSGKKYFLWTLMYLFIPFFLFCLMVESNYYLISKNVDFGIGHADYLNVLVLCSWYLIVFFVVVFAFYKKNNKSLE